MKKIAIFDNDISNIGGVEKVALNLANELVEKYEVYIIGLMQQNDKIPYELDKKIHYVKLLDYGNYRLRELVARARKPLRKILKQEKIDVLLSMATYNGLISAIDCLGLRTKVIFCDHGALINQLNEKSTTMARLISSIFSKHIVVLTDQSLQDYQKIFKTSKNKISRIYNWIDDDIFKYVKEYKKDSNKIISVGRIASEKGFDMLVEVAKNLKFINDNWQWDVYGDGTDFEKIKNKIHEENLENNVILKGNENFMYDKYNDYAMLVLPSYREGLPLVLLEAKANRLPIVSFDIKTGPTEIVSNNKNGFIVEAYDKKTMADKINELLLYKNLREEFSNNSYEKIDEFKKEQILEKWIELIERI